MSLFSFDKKFYGMESKKINSLHLNFIPNQGKDRILLIHGAGMSSMYFFPLMQKLHELDLEPWAVDLRGHGESSPCSLKKVHVWDYVNDLKEIMHNLKPSMLLGHSMGGFIAQKLASEFQLKSIILVCSVPPKKILLIPKRTWFLALTLMINFPLILLGQYKAIEKKTLFKLAFNNVNKKMHPFFLSRYLTESPHFLKDMRKTGYGVIRPYDIKCPILVMGAKHDLLVRWKTAQKTAQFYGAYFTLLENSGHKPMIEKELDMMTQDIKDFLYIISHQNKDEPNY